MAELTTEQKAAIDSDLGKVGKSVAKVGLMLIGWVESLGTAMSPVLERVLTNVLTGLAERWGQRVLEKNGVKM